MTTSITLAPNTQSFEPTPDAEYHEISEEEIEDATSADGDDGGGGGGGSSDDSGGGTSSVDEEGTTTTTDGQEDTTEDVVSSVLQKNGLSYKEFSEEISTNGKLSADSYAKLAKSGFSKEMVDTYVAGIKATEELGQKHVQEVMAVVGGKEKFTDLITWASKNLTQSEQDAYNTMVSGNNPNTAKAAVEWLQSKRRSVEGYTPTLVSGSHNKPNLVKPFANSEQVLRAMSDPRYKSDSAYREAVSRRLMVSDV